MPTSTLEMNSMSTEGRVNVPGAVLQYRRAGTGRGPLLVFENGWGASHHVWAWVERKLAPHAQLLFYDRAGIGGSVGTAPQTVARLTRQFDALVKALGFTEPVIVVGHSYGGLVGALHVAQRPQSIRALVQLDASPWRHDRALDASFGVIRAMVPLLKLWARMGWRDPLFARACATLPEPEASLLVKRAFGSVDSLRSAASELRLLPEIRRVIGASPSDKKRLILSAGKVHGKSTFAVERMQVQHRAYATRGEGGAWDELPHDHGGMVFTEAGAADVAQRIGAFLQEAHEAR